MAQAPLAPENRAADRRVLRRRWRWIILGLLVLMAAAHAPILRGLARALIADDPAAADALLLLRGDGRFDLAAKLLHSGAVSRILVMDRPATRLVRLGIVPSSKDQCLRELLRRGIGPESISFLPGSDEMPWQVAGALQAWLVKHPRSRVLVVCERFKSGNQRFILDRVLETGEADRVTFRGLPDHRYDESNWWRSRAGVRAFTEMIFNLAYDGLHGDDAQAASEVDLDQFERTLLLSAHSGDGRP